MGEPKQKNPSEEIVDVKNEIAQLEAQRVFERDMKELEVLNEKFAAERKRFLQLYQRQNNPVFNDN